MSTKALVELIFRSDPRKRWGVEASPFANVRIDRQFYVVALASFYLATIARAIRAPNGWAKAHWLIGYETGAFKRSLMGTLIRPLVNASLATPEATITIVASLVEFVFLALLFRQVLRSFLAQGSYGRMLLSAVMLTSPYVFCAADLTGYFDGLVVLSGLAATELVQQRRTLWAGVIVALAVLIHESTIIVALPVVALAAMLQHCEHFGSESRTMIAVRAFARTNWPLLLPAVVFGLVAFRQSHWFRCDEARTNISARLAEFAFLTPSERKGVMDAFTHSFLSYFREESPSFWDRVLNPALALRILPTAALLTYAAASCIWLRDEFRRWRFALVMVLALAVSSPLLMHAIAWDTSRIWSYHIIIAFLALSMIARNSQTCLDMVLAKPWLQRLPLVVLALNVFLELESTDAPVVRERFSWELRTVFYALPLLVLLIAGDRVSRGARARASQRGPSETGANRRGRMTARKTA